jgi:hypothetical protein
MTKPFRVNIRRSRWDKAPDYWLKFENHCLKKFLTEIKSESQTIQDLTDLVSVMNLEIQPNGTVVKTRQSLYLLWKEKQYHTMFLLKWT